MEIKNEAEHVSVIVVDSTKTAKALGSGTMDVLATPALVALMENAAMLAVTPYLAAGDDTVGIEIATTHTKATPLGATVRATAVVTEIEGRKISFEITAEDEQGVIGQAKHTRFIVNREKFLAKLKK